MHVKGHDLNHDFFFLYISCFYIKRLWFFLVMLGIISLMGGSKVCSVVWFFFLLPQRESRMWYSVTSIIAHLLLVLPALLGGIPQPSILSPSCQMSNVCGDSLRIQFIWNRSHTPVQTQDVYTSYKLTYSKL